MFFGISPPMPHASVVAFEIPGDQMGFSLYYEEVLSKSLILHAV